MKPNQKKVNYLRVILSSIAVVIIIAASFAMPILIYIAMAVLGVLIIWNMKRIEHIYTTAEEVVDAREPIPQEEINQIKKEEEKKKSQEEVVENYIKAGMQKGYELKQIVDVLKKNSYDMVLVKEVCERLGLLNQKPKEPEPKEITAELDKEIKEEEPEEDSVDELKKQIEILKKQRGGRPPKKKPKARTKKVEVDGKMKEVEIMDNVEEDIFGGE